MRVRGSFIHSKGPKELEIIHDGIIKVSKDGIIESIETNPGDIEHIDLHLKQGEFLVPGFFDTHIHAPQYPFAGTGYDKTLLDWLDAYTFPQEAKFADTCHARACYERIVKRTLECGTTTACYFGTIHLGATKVLADIVKDKGQCAYIGKVNMDRNSPETLIESTKQSIDDTLQFIKYCISLNSSLVTPIVTPRFVPSCTPELMKALGEISKTYNIPIQSHISENKGEIEWVKELHPECDSYSQVYESFGLLNDHTVMAHCIHLTKEERELFKKNKVGISHCPNSNFSLGSGVCNVARLFAEGIDKIGLGTDVAGGYSSSIMDAMRQAVIASKASSFVSSFPSLSIEQVFYLATLGGANVLNLQEIKGNFEVGKRFDALVVSTSAPGNIDAFPHDDLRSMFEKFVFQGDDRNIRKVFVHGRLVIDKETHARREESSHYLLS